MTSHLEKMPPSTTTTDDDDSSDDSCSSTSDFTSSQPVSQFSRFGDLPPELRHLIWRFAIPSPGINFFNVHCFPNDHVGCNRSTSPPSAYLDLRRLDIEHHDHEVFRYDPSSWQARYSVRQACREARLICVIPESKAATITLTRPKRGLFVRAGDGQLRTTPLHPRRNTGHDEGIAVPLTEPVARRTVQVHIDDILSLSVENCSFNLPHEETPSFSSDDDVDGLATGNADEGWAYDPQLTPNLPQAIPSSRLCASMARCNTAALRNTTDALFGLLYSHMPGFLDIRPGELWPGRLLLMFDANTQALGERDLEELTSTPEVVWDRFGDCYVRLPWRTGDFNPPDGFPIMYRLTKIWPETNNIRDRYLRSALLHSPKRPARFS
ncbi:hypothetical protein HD806DRAFT_261498 [Xylariaceae sp. AK1471]|nr:hypothetical protein HD806DRAFT_261498 [Xylariaceae sp. AK1471]